MTLYTEPIRILTYPKGVIMNPDQNQPQQSTDVPAPELPVQPPTSFETPTEPFVEATPPVVVEPTPADAATPSAPSSGGFDDTPSASLDTEAPVAVVTPLVAAPEKKSSKKMLLVLVAVVIVLGVVVAVVAMTL